MLMEKLRYRQQVTRSGIEILNLFQISIRVWWSNDEYKCGCPSLKLKYGNLRMTVT